LQQTNVRIGGLQVKDVGQTPETERLQAILNTLTDEHLHKVLVYARTLAQIEKEKQPEKPTT